MGMRGRPSSASLAIVSTGGIESVRRPDPPENLDDEEAAEWRAVVDRLPAHWFPRETHALLEAFCSHAVEMRRLAQLLDRERASEEFDFRRYDKILAARERESKALSTLATRMRVSQHSTLDKSKPKGPFQAQAKPWS